MVTYSSRHSILWPIPPAGRFWTCYAAGAWPPVASLRHFQCRARQFPNLRFLRRARLVHEQRDRRLRVSDLNANLPRSADSWVSQYRAFWETHPLNPKTFVEAQPAQELQASIGKKNSAARNLSKKKGTNSWSTIPGLFSRYY